MKQAIRTQLSLIILAAVVSMGTACQYLGPFSADPPQPKSVRISDRYSRASVDSYEIFKGEIDQHHFAMIHLVSGERFPMVCRVVAEGIYPIPQSVFSSGGDLTEWRIICEPRLEQAYALIRLSVSSKGGSLRIEGEEFNRLTNKPKLLPRPPIDRPKP